MTWVLILGSGPGRVAITGYHSERAAVDAGWDAVAKGVVPPIVPPAEPGFKVIQGPRTCS